MFTQDQLKHLLLLGFYRLLLVGKNIATFLIDIFGLYFEISNSTRKQRLTIDTRDVNDLGPTKFRTQADSDTQRICYYNRNWRDRSLNSFLAVRKESPSASEITFSIVKVIDKTNRHNTKYSEISDELSDFKNDIVQQTIQRTSESDLARETTDKRPGRW